MRNDAVRLDPSILREYDIRGRVGRTLHVADARAIGRAFGTIAVAAGARAVVVGYDGRLTSPALERSLVEGLTGSGLDVIRIGRGPTPMLYFALFDLDIAAGVMVTGSHNPPDYNGFKLLLDRTPLTPAEIGAIAEIAGRGAFARGAGHVRSIDVGPSYVDRLIRSFRQDRPLRIAWDAGNGAAGDVLSRLAAQLPGAHTLLNAAVDGNFPSHHPDPAVPANLRQLRAAVVAEGCDIGIAFDGDADRIGVVDETGAIVWPDQVLLLLARAMLVNRPGAPIVADVKSSQLLFDGIAAAGGRPVMSASGYTLLQRRMRELSAPLAGELSGHIFFADDYHGVDDALYCAMRLLSVIAAGESLAAFRRGLPAAVNTPELRIPCPDPVKRSKVAELASHLRAAGADLIAIDGVRVRTADGWWLVRASNTEPVLAARCEAGDVAALDRLKVNLAEHLRLIGLDPPQSLIESSASGVLGRGDDNVGEALSGMLERP